MRVSTNNPFSIHGINHLSASSINLFVEDKAMWCMTYLMKTPRTTSPSAIRGNAIEHGINIIHNAPQQFSLSDTAKEVGYKYDQLLREAEIDLDDEKAEQERQSLRCYLDTYTQFIPSSWFETKPVSYQEEILINYGELPVPLKGFIDFRFDKYIVDLKTTTKMPSKLTDAHCRQMAVYSMAYPDLDMYLNFVTPKKFSIFAVDDLDKWRQQVFDIAISIQRFLSASDDKLELTLQNYPNFDHWKWDELKQKQAKEIWSIK